MRNRLLIACVSLLLAACTIGPDYVRPTIESQPQWRLDYAAAAGLADSAWWEQFGDPVLDGLIDAALKENLDLQVAAARVDQYLGLLQTTRAEFFPQLSAGASVSRTDDTDTGPFPGDSGPYNYSSTPAGRSTCGGASAAPTRRPAPNCWPARPGGGRSCSA